MHWTNFVKAGVGLALVALLAVGFWTRTTWQGWLRPTKHDADDEAKTPAHEHADRIRLSAQAQKNLRLVVKELQPTTYWRKIHLPGSVVDRPGHSDRGIPAPIAGVVTQVYAAPGKTVHVGDDLFRLKIVSESFQASQMELFKSVRELEIAQKERKRLEGAAVAIPNSKLLELQYQAERFNVLIHAHRQDLSTRQLTKDQIDKIEKGEFVTEVVIRMPDRQGKQAAKSADPSQQVEYEVQELKVNLGDHVQAGQMLAYLADHRSLYIEGRALVPEIKLLAQAAKEGWPVEAEFSDDEDGAPGERLTDLKIEFLGNTMDATGLTLPIYVRFDNPPKEYVRQGTTHRTGQFRPGQKVLLKVGVAKKDKVFVLPLGAVVRDGPDAYVFLQNGDVFLRLPVHVILEDTGVVVIERDGSILDGSYVAHNAAAALNRALKAKQTEGGGGHGHHHDD